MTRRVVITGLGPVSAIGTGTAAFSAGVRAGRSGISPITSFDTTGFPHYMGGEVQDFHPKQILRRIVPEQWGRTSQFAAAAARLAVADAHIDESRLSAARAGSTIGTTGGEALVLEHLTEQGLGTGYAGVCRDMVKQVPSSRISVAVNRELGLTGDAITLSTACSASNYAIGFAYDQIRFDEADFMLAGGADSIMRWSHAGFFRLGALTEKACSPFDQDRSGILTGEGGAVLFLETLDSARARGVRIYAEVLGYGLNCDAAHMVAPDPASIAQCIRLAHCNAGVRPDDIDYICAHGTGTPANDLMEARAVAEVFGSRLPPISSIKSMLGHTMGAASAFSAIASVLGIHESFIPPTINFRTLDPQLPPIDPVPNRARTAELNVVQVNGFAFGGNNAITVFGKVS